MAKPFWAIFGLFLALDFAGGAIDTPKNQPVEITSTGQTNYENGLATARDNVAIHIGDADIYADYAQYNSQKHEVFVQGNVRIYRDVNMYVGEQAIYNTDTKEIRSVNMQTEYFPYFVSGGKITSIGENAYLVENGDFSTHDAPSPDFHLHARTVRIYENDRVVFQNVTLYGGKIPLFWFPYLYQSLNDAFSFSISPAYLSSWGPSLLTQVTFPIRDNIKGTLRLDYRGRRGVAVGFDSEIEYGKDNNSWLHLKTYYLQDQNPLLNRTDVPRGLVSTGRYRVTLQDHTEFTDDIYAIINVTKLSDAFVMEDFFHNDFRIDPVPDNVVAVAKTSSWYSLTAIARFQANEFFDQTERLPEVVLDIKRTSLFGSPIFYEGETGIANLNRNFSNVPFRVATPNTSASPSPSPTPKTELTKFENYGALRFDTFHQLSYPNTYFGWLSIVPRAGFRATYYDQTRDLGKTMFQPSENPLVPAFLLPEPTNLTPIKEGESVYRTVVNAGAEASFKISREWEDVQDRTFGLDGLRHIIQPFTNFSWVSEDGVDPRAVLQFDRFEPSTQLRAIDFPQFTSIDSIDQWTVWRVGVRNRLQTRRDDLTVSWLDLETYFDVNLDNPYDRTPYSNLFNKLKFTPLPWASLVINSQIPVFDKGFTEVNTNVVIQPMANLELSAGHRYLNSNPFFKNSSLFVVGGYYRIDDNWGIGVQEQYEGITGIIEQQRYSIYRDLTSWVASLGAVIRDNGGVKEYGVLFTFTLKAFPKFGFDFNFDPQDAAEQ